MDVEKILAKIEIYWENQKFNEAIELAEKSLNIHKDDYRLFNILSKGYSRLTPARFLINYDSLTSDQVQIQTNYIIKSIKYGEQSLSILLNNINELDKDLLNSSMILDDLTSVILTYTGLFEKLKRKNDLKKYTIHLDHSLRDNLLNFYQRGFERFDESFEEFRLAYIAFDEITKY